MRVFQQPVKALSFEAGWLPSALVLRAIRSKLNGDFGEDVHFIGNRRHGQFGSNGELGCARDADGSNLAIAAHGSGSGSSGDRNRRHLAMSFSLHGTDLAWDACRRNRARGAD